MNISTAMLLPFMLGHGAMRSIHAYVNGADANMLRITYQVNGNIDQLKIPANSYPAGPIVSGSIHVSRHSSVR